ncbi:MAG: hypothetical protein AB1393_05115 [Candidatus Edwardsbacteria bacterium]
MAKKIKNYRSGDLKETLGICLLEGIGAVAPIPREEDVGMDAVVTLFQPDGRLLFAQQSFYVQLKSSLIQEIVFEKDDVNWLKMINIPFFWGLVDGENAKIYLFSTNKLYEFLDNNEYTYVKILFGEGATRDDFKELEVYLGSPIIEWSIADIFKSDFNSFAFNILSEWIEIASDNIRCRQFGIYKGAQWSTNQPPQIDCFTMITISDFTVTDKDVKKTLEFIEPFLARLIHQLAKTKGIATEFPKYMISLYKKFEVSHQTLEVANNLLVERGMIRDNSEHKDNVNNK